MTRSKILLQLDCDPHPSVFDAVVAIDAGVDHLLRHGGVRREDVESLVHGAMFTRGGDALRHTAVFIGGSDVMIAEELLQATSKAFFGPVRVSVMLDAGGCNTTAAAAVLSAARHLDLAASTAVVLGGTGPVGRRVAHLLAVQGCHVRVASRSPDRAAAAAGDIHAAIPEASVEGVMMADDDSAAQALRDCHAVLACGAAGVRILDAEAIQKAEQLQLLIDLNAVPPAGIEGVEPTDQGEVRGGRVCYGAIGVGGLKMKIHRAALQSLFESNDRLLDADQIYAIGAQLTDGRDDQ